MTDKEWKSDRERRVHSVSVFLLKYLPWCNSDSSCVAHGMMFYGSHKEQKTVIITLSSTFYDFYMFNPKTITD